MIFSDPGLVPNAVTIENYISGWKGYAGTTFGTFFMNSLAMCAIAIIGNLISCSMAAYAFSRLNFTGKRFWVWRDDGNTDATRSCHTRYHAISCSTPLVGWVRTCRYLCRNSSPRTHSSCFCSCSSCVVCQKKLRKRRSLMAVAKSGYSCGLSYRLQPLHWLQLPCLPSCGHGMTFSTTCSTSQDPIHSLYQGLYVPSSVMLARYPIGVVL